MALASVHLTDDDLWLLETLTWRLRVATFEQLRLGIGCRPRPFERRVTQLQTAQLIWSRSVVIPILAIAEPLVIWMPGDAMPDWDALAWQLAGRWIAAQPQSVRLVWAAPLAERIVGGQSGGLRQPLQVAHDVGVAAVFFRRCEQTPSTARQWLSEDIFRQQYRAVARHKVPDAVLLNRAGQVRTAIEFGGRYSADRLRRLHRKFARRHWHYEIW